MHMQSGRSAGKLRRPPDHISVDCIIAVMMHSRLGFDHAVAVMLQCIDFERATDATRFVVAVMCLLAWWEIDLCTVAGRSVGVGARLCRSHLMYVCMYVCMCVCMCVYVCVCLFVCTVAGRSVGVGARLCRSHLMYVCMCVCMYVCVSVCVCMCVYVCLCVLWQVVAWVCVCVYAKVI